MNDDIALILKFRGGEKSAAEVLMANYKSAVNKLARAFYVKGADRDDVVQEGMIALYNAIVTYDIDSGITFSTYAIGCIRHRILDCVRSGNRLKHKALTDSVSMSVLDDSLVTGLSAEEIAINTEETGRIRSFLEEKLSEEESVVLDMYYDGCSYAEIADAIGKNTKSVDNTLQKIRRKLRAELNIDR